MQSNYYCQAEGDMLFWLLVARYHIYDTFWACTCEFLSFNVLESYGTNLHFFLSLPIVIRSFMLGNQIWLRCGMWVKNSHVGKAWTNWGPYKVKRSMNLIPRGFGLRYSIWPIAVILVSPLDSNLPGVSWMWMPLTLISGIRSDGLTWKRIGWTIVDEWC